MVSGSPLPPVRFCPASPHSDGGPARLVARRSTSISAGELRIGIRDAVPFQAASAVYGPERGRTPLGAGLLCVGGTTTSLTGATFLDAGGAWTERLDFGAPPLGSGPAAVASGETWIFQAWFRDGGAAAGSNTTNALAITFCP